MISEVGIAQHWVERYRFKPITIFQNDSPWRTCPSHFDCPGVDVAEARYNSMVDLTPARNRVEIIVDNPDFTNEKIGECLIGSRVSWYWANSLHVSGAWPLRLVWLGHQTLSGRRPPSHNLKASYRRTFTLLACVSFSNDEGVVWLCVMELLGSCPYGGNVRIEWNDERGRRQTVWFPATSILDQLRYLHSLKWKYRCRNNEGSKQIPA